MYVAPRPLTINLAILVPMNSVHFAGSYTYSISEDGNEYCIDVDLPGVRREDIHADVRANALLLRAEMRQERQGGRGTNVTASDTRHASGQA